jgi:hypothetical protein
MTQPEQFEQRPWPSHRILGRRDLDQSERNSSTHAWISGITATFLSLLSSLWSAIKSYSTVVLYLKLIFWFFSTVISFIPFIWVETNMFSTWRLTISEMYAKHYEGVLSVFVAMIAVAMFDMITAMVLAGKHHSYNAVSAAAIVGVLFVLLFGVGLTLGGTIMMTSIIKDHKVELGVMHGSILTFATVFCLFATAFAATLSKEYQTPPA